MWETLWNKIKEVIRRMLPAKTIEQTLHVVPIMSNEMAAQLDLWDRMYKDQAPWLHLPSKGDTNDPVKIVSLGLPSMIASEKARMAVLEMKSEITVPMKEVEVEVPDEAQKKFNELTGQDRDPSRKEQLNKQKGTEVASQKSQLGDDVKPKDDMPTKTEVQKKPVGPDDRAKWLNEAYQTKIVEKLRPQLEYGIAKGGLVIKPYIVMKKVADDKGVIKDTPQLEVDYIQADSFYPLAFNGSGDITEAAFVQTKVDKNTIYRRLEHHKLVGTTVTVQNKAFMTQNTQTQVNMNDTELGKEIPLTSVPEWADLKPTTTIKNVDRLLFAYFKMPEANTIDPLSPLGVSGYSRAVAQIREADMQFSRMLWEFEATEAAIDIDRDALMDVRDNKGVYHYVNPTLQQRLFRPIDLGESNTYQPFLPSIRDASLINGLNNILMRIEDICALSRGTLSDVTAEAKTATELKILKQRSYQANASIQKALENALKDVIYVMNVYATLYDITKDGEYEASFEWDDSILVDVESELGHRITLMQNGLSSKLEVRMWYFGETEEQAREALAKIQDESLANAQQNLLDQMSMGQMPKQFNDEMD